MDYDAIAEAVRAATIEVQMGHDQTPLPPAMAPKQYLPENHEKYSGIATARRGGVPRKTTLGKVRYSHDAIIDIILAEPTITQKEIARRLGRTNAWIGVIFNSDSFQAALAKRRDDLFDPIFRASVEDRFKGLAAQATEVIANRLETTQNPDLAVKALEITSKALGFGARPSATVNVSPNFVVQLPEKSPDAASWSAKFAKPLTP